MTQPRCLVMGILNRTPDSFYDGGRMVLDDSLDHARAMVEQGAAIIDVGAVRAGPGPVVGTEEELARLVPVVEALRGVAPAISVETADPGVAREALRAGATLINDVSGLADPELAGAAAAAGAGIVVMHNGRQIRGRPRHPRYEDVVAEVAEELERLATTAEQAGVPRHRVYIDPGLDFGKTTFHSLRLMDRLDALVATGRPVLVAASRKDVVGEALGLPVEDRLEGSLALAVLAAAKGARVVRVHDVGATVRAVRMVEAVRGIFPPVAPRRGLWD